MDLLCIFIWPYGSLTYRLLFLYLVLILHSLARLTTVELMKGFTPKIALRLSKKKISVVNMYVILTCCRVLGNIDAGLKAAAFGRLWRLSNARATFTGGVAYRTLDSVTYR